MVDDAAVAAALEDGRLGGAAFDVFEAEPLDETHPFMSLSETARARLLMTPHIGGQTQESKSRNFQVAIDNVVRVSSGEEPSYRAPV